MARARNIKPSLFKNEVLGIADPLYTILFEGLWVLADRNGRLEDRPLRLKIEIFPYRDLPDFDARLQWLHDERFIIRYQADGQRYIQIVNFEKHQKVHPNETPSVIPEYKEVIRPSTNGTSPSTIGESTCTLTLPSFTSFPSLPSSNLHSERSFAEQVLDAIREELGLNQLPNEPLWLIEIERAQKNNFTVEHCVETFQLMQKQDWRTGPIKPATWSENLPIINKLRLEIAGQNGTDQIKAQVGKDNGAEPTYNCPLCFDLGEVSRVPDNPQYEWEREYVPCGCKEKVWK